MGKKKVIKQTQEEVLKETETREETQKQSIKKAVEKTRGVKVVEAKVFIQATYNNVMITITDLGGNVLAWGTSGSLGFKGPKKATPFAASKVAETLVEKIKKIGIRDLYILINGIGSGRESAIRVFGARGFNILSIKDTTPIPHNGCRPRKPRRV